MALGKRKIETVSGLEPPKPRVFRGRDEVAKDKAPVTSPAVEEPKDDEKPKVQPAAAPKEQPRPETKAAKPKAPKKGSKAKPKTVRCGVSMPLPAKEAARLEALQQSLNVSIKDICGVVQKRAHEDFKPVAKFFDAPSKEAIWTEYRHPVTVTVDLDLIDRIRGDRDPLGRFQNAHWIRDQFVHHWWKVLKEYLDEFKA